MLDFLHNEYKWRKPNKLNAFFGRRIKSVLKVRWNRPNTRDWGSDGKNSCPETTGVNPNNKKFLTALWVSFGLTEFLSKQMMTCSQCKTSSAYSSRETKASLLPLNTHCSGLSSSWCPDESRSSAKNNLKIKMQKKMLNIYKCLE